jgi:hypothetical protein
LGKKKRKEDKKTNRHIKHTIDDLQEKRKRLEKRHSMCDFTQSKENDYYEINKQSNR